MSFASKMEDERERAAELPLLPGSTIGPCGAAASVIRRPNEVALTSHRPNKMFSRVTESPLQSDAPVKVANGVMGIIVKISERGGVVLLNRLNSGTLAELATRYSAKPKGNKLWFAAFEWGVIDLVDRSVIEFAQAMPDNPPAGAKTRRVVVKQFHGHLGHEATWSD